MGLQTCLIIIAVIRLTQCSVAAHDSCFTVAYFTNTYVCRDLHRFPSAVCTSRQFVDKTVNAKSNVKLCPSLHVFTNQIRFIVLQELNNIIIAPVPQHIRLDLLYLNGQLYLGPHRTNIIGSFSRKYLSDCPLLE